MAELIDAAVRRNPVQLSSQMRKGAFKPAHRRLGYLIASGAYSEEPITLKKMDPAAAENEQLMK